MSLGVFQVMQDTNINHSGMKISALDSAESIPHSIAKTGDSAYKRALTVSKSKRPSPKKNSGPQKLPKLKVSKVTGRYPYDELVKISLCGSINYEHSRIPSQELVGNLDEIKEVLQKYKIPDFNENNPVAISLLVKDKANQPQYQLAIRDISMILNYYLIKRVRQQLEKIPNQLLTTEFSADLLHISQESLMELLNRGEIPFQMSKNFQSIRSSDLHEYIKKLSKIREQAFFEMRQCEY